MASSSFEDSKNKYDWFKVPDLPTYTSIVCDNGSYSLKVGYGGAEQPHSIIPTFVGKPRAEMSAVGYGQRYMYVGKTAIEQRGVLDTTSRPIHDGLITDWDAMEEMWTHMFYEVLMVPPEKLDILHTEPVGNPKNSREKLTEIMFELFNVPRMSVVPAPTLAMYGSGGDATGVVVDSGYDGTRVVPTYEGYPLKYPTNVVPVGGRQVTEYMTRLLNDRGTGLIMPKHIDAVSAIKEKHCYVATQDLRAERRARNREQQLVFELPDDQLIEDKGEVFRAPEVMFDPGLFGVDSKLGGVHEAVYKTITSSYIDLQKNMFGNIVLTGGNTLFPHMAARLTKAIKGLIGRTSNRLAISNMNVRVVAHPGRQFATWVGGSILASATTFQKSCIDRLEYSEFGTTLVHKRCFI